MPRYAISLDTDTITETLDAHAFGVTQPSDALNLLAIRAGVLFHNVTSIASTDTVFFGATQRFAFDATPADVATFTAFYDADPAIVEPYDA